MAKRFFHGINNSTHSTRLLTSTWLIACTLSSGAVQYLEVKGDRVNLRAAAKADAEVVGQVGSTDTLILQGDITDPWVKVTPPDRVDFWIYASLVKDGKVTANNAQVRAGAGLNFNVVGQLQDGDTVSQRGKIGDWIKIAPFPTSAVWVTNAYVSLKETPKPKLADPLPTAQPPQSVEPTAITSLPEPVEPSPAATANAEPVIETPPSQPPAIPKPIVDQILVQSADPVNPASETDSRLAPPVIPPNQVNQVNRTSKPASRTLFGAKTTEETVGPAAVPASRLRKDHQQIISGSYAGTLALAPSGTHPTQYRLVSFTPDNKPRTICYVLGNSRQLDSLKGGFFTIEGAVYWFEGTSLPTVYAQNILRHQQL